MLGIEFLSPEGVKHKVGTAELTFYAVSVGTAKRYRKIVKPLAAAITGLLAKEKDLRKYRQNDITDGSQTGCLIEYEAISIEAATFLIENKKKSLEKLIDELTSDENFKIIGAIIVDSLRDNFPRDKKPTEAEIAAFLDELDLEVLVEMLIGVIKANTKLFHPLREWVSKALQETLKSVKPTAEATPASILKMKDTGIN